MREIDVAGYAYPARGVGPGDRLILWVRGCDRACPGCMAPELWRSGEPTQITDVVAGLLPSLTEADGLTISGGEPFQQAAAVACLIDALRGHIPMLEVLVYTGYLLEELQDTGIAERQLLERIDMLVDGAFDEMEPNQLIWRGSDNQRIHLLSTRSLRYAAVSTSHWPDARPIGVQMLDADILKIVGIPRRGDIEKYREAVAAAGMRVRKAT